MKTIYPMSTAANTHAYISEISRFTTLDNDL